MSMRIVRPSENDAAELQKLFQTVIADAFEQDGLDDANGVAFEVQKQMNFLRQDFESGGSDVFFLVAKKQERIIGTIAYSKPSELILKYLKIDASCTPEVTTVYVLPEFQGKGVGTVLFHAILKELHDRKTEYICLDGGYRKSQGFWIKKLGQPDVTLENYWGKGLHHMIWHRRMEEFMQKGV